MSKPTLVLLAAGMGSRYGGLKQLVPVGPGGATIMDYSVYDAIRAGFGKLVFVIRPDMEDAVRTTRGRRYESRLPVAYAFQDLAALPAGFSVPDGRTKPWGTGHAVLCAAEQVHEPFAVANADDFYGANSFAAVGQFLRTAAADGATYAMVGYALRDTMSEIGAVSRGVCHCTPDGWLENIIETKGIERSGTDGRVVEADGRARTLPGDTVVSMNLWAFTPALFEQLRRGFGRFLGEHGQTMDRELYLPAVIHDEMRAGHAKVKVLPTRDVWCGLTHTDDTPRVQAMMRRLVDEGQYPAELWT